MAASTPVSAEAATNKHDPVSGKAAMSEEGMRPLLRRENASDVICLMGDKPAVREGPDETPVGCAT